MNETAVRNGASQMADLTLFIERDAGMPERGLIDLTSEHVRNVLPSLLKDRTTKGNIVWGTDAYADLGYGCSDFISPEAFRTGIPVRLKARTEKTDSEQLSRTRGKAEVFTPGWICNRMNNHCDSEWFGREDVFNVDNGDGTWTATEGKIAFPEGKTWKEYVDSRRLEITCGEAPFLVSRYDASTGEPILLGMRIGMFDRKMRVVDENATSEEEWMEWAVRALQSCYGYEFQGDSLLIARVNLLESFVDYCMDRLGHAPDEKTVSHIANIISWNLWQMDGLRYCPPYAVMPAVQFDLSMFGPDSGTASNEKVPFHSKIYDWRRDNSVAFIKCRKRGKMDRKLFDYVIGNPPYQETKEHTSDKQIYNDFMDSAFQVGDRVELITPARFLFRAGNSSKEWIDRMLDDPHLKVLHYEQKSCNVFPGTDIKGGIAITYRDSNSVIGPIGTFTIYEQLNSIILKVVSNEFIPITGYINVQTKFNLDALYEDKPEYRKLIGSEGRERRLTTSIFSLDIFKKNRAEDSDVAILGLVGNRREYRWIDSKYIEDTECLHSYKVILPKSNGSGAIGEVLSTPLIGEPLIGFTQTFLGIGCFSTENEAENCLKYIKTKFARTMLGTLKVTQHNNLPTWANVPMQDFTSDSDIDWSDSIRGIDLQLYRKYNLTPDEVKFIESHVKEMD